MSEQNPYKLDEKEPIGQLSSMTIKALIVGIVTVVASFGLKWTIDDAALDKVVAGIASLVTLTSMVVAWIGRLRATKVVNSQVNPLVRQEQTKRSWDDKVARGLFVLLPLLTLQVGCTANTPPLVQVYSAKQVYIGSLDALTLAINTGQIADRETLLAIKAVRVELDAAFAEATTLARAGNSPGLRLALDRINAALERFLLLANPGRGVSPSSINTETPWTQQRFSLSSLEDRKSSLAYSMPTRPPRPETLSATRSRGSWTSSSPQPVPATTPH